MTKTAHITEEFQPYMVRNIKTFQQEHSKYLKRRKRLFLNGKTQEIEVLTIMNQQFMYKEDTDTFHFTCDLQYKIKEEIEDAST